MPHEGKVVSLEGGHGMTGSCPLCTEPTLGKLIQQYHFRRSTKPPSGSVIHRTPRTQQSCYTCSYSVLQLKICKGNRYIGPEMPGSASIQFCCPGGGMRIAHTSFSNDVLQYTQSIASWEAHLSLAVQVFTGGWSGRHG